MAETYTTKPGDVLDLIVWRAYPRLRPTGAARGGLSGALDAVLAANHGLGDALHSPRLAAGLTIALPDLSPGEASPKLVRLWD